MIQLTSRYDYNLHIIYNNDIILKLKCATYYSPLYNTTHKKRKNFKKPSVLKDCLIKPMFFIIPK